MAAEFITDGKGFFVAFDSPLVTGYMPVPIPKGDPVLHWRGPKIDLETQWYPALKFMADHAEHEVILRLFMLRDRSAIVLCPLTQIYGTGMSVKEDIEVAEREWWSREGMIECGTMHSHCDGGAFASGTDRSDEAHRDGLHVTIGKLKHEQFDLHARMTWTIPGEEHNGQLVRAAVSTTQDVELLDWFTFPDWVLDFIRHEPPLTDSVIRYFLVRPPGKEVTYPESWKTKLVRRPTVTFPAPQYGQPYGHAPLSMIDDLPGFGSEIKKKEESPNPNPNGQNEKLRFNLIWDLWSEVLALVADSPACREAKVSISDFEPPIREVLFRQVPQAREVWEAILKMLAGNNVTEQEFFKEFGK